jgi:hypothetical protein
MTRPRKELVSLADTPYYHISSRCVRRGFLCGYDAHSKRDYEHRRQWIEDRIRLLASLFAIEICSYSVMSNHYHLVVKLAPEQAEPWSDDEVIDRWLSLYKGPLLVQRHRAGGVLDDAEQEVVRDVCQQWRERLTNLSGFMGCLNQPIARRANKEDNCTGHFSWAPSLESSTSCQHPLC